MRRTLITPALLLFLAACSADPSAGEQQSSAAASQEAQSSIGRTGAELTSIDDEWNLYTNYDLGFSMKLPTKVFASTGQPTVAMKTFEDTQNRRAFIAPETYYTFTDSTTPLPVSLQLLQSDRAIDVPNWEITAVTAQSDQALEQYLKDEFGPGCIITERKATGQDDVVDITISQGDPNDEDPTCYVYFAMIIRHSPSRQKAFYWILGQDVRFVSDEQSGTLYDLEMVNSFRFL